MFMHEFRGDELAYTSKLVPEKLRKCKLVSELDIN